MITIRPSIFCFFGKLAGDLYGSVPVAIRRRLGVVPDVFAFVSVTEDGVDLKLGSRRPKPPAFEGGLQNRLWQTLTFAAAAIGNIRVRVDALRRPAETDLGFQVVRGGPDIYLVECLSDPLGWEALLGIAEKIYARNEAPPSAGRARGVFPLFHLPSQDEDLEREQALEGLRKLESLVRRGILFPSIVLDRVNRNGYPLERWEDLTELVSEFLAIGSASEAAGDIWRTFPLVADLHGMDGAGSPGLSSIGLSRFRFSQESIAEELARHHLRDVQRALARTFSSESPQPSEEQCRDFLGSLVARKASSIPDGDRRMEEVIVDWIRSLDSSASPGLVVWAKGLDRLQLALFERLGETAQRVENIRQESEALGLESPLKESWIARLSVLFPSHMAYVPTALAGALGGSFLGCILQTNPLAGYFEGAAAGGLAGLALGWVIRQRRGKETFTLGELSESAFTTGFPSPRTLEYHGRRKSRGAKPSGVTLQLWGELKTQVEPEERQKLEEHRKRLVEDLEFARGDEAELIFLDRCINSLREQVEGWRAKLSEVGVWEPGGSFSGDVFPADGPRKIYEWLGGRESAEAAVAPILSRAEPGRARITPMDAAEEVATAWGKEKAATLTLEKILEILDDRPGDLLERLSEACAPLWPRPGDRDELLRCFGEGFSRFARENDLRHSLRDEATFVRVLGGVRSGELAKVEP